MAGKGNAMAGGLLMPRGKTSKDDEQSSGEPTVTPAEAQELKEMRAAGGFNARIALRAEFKEKLDEIAKSLDSTPGAIIEQRLRRFVKAEYPKALKKKGEAAEAKLREIQGRGD